MKILLAIGLIALIFIFIFGYVRLALGGRGTRSTIDVWREFKSRPVFRQAVMIWLFVFLFDLVQTSLDQDLTRSLRIDFTPVLFEFEGTATAWVQQTLSLGLSFKPFTWLLALAYWILFPALLFGSAHAYDRLDDAPRLKMTAYVYALNYLFCLPFYILFPVVEPWAYSPANVVALSDHHMTGSLIDILRPMSGLDNCFPSYHTSLTVSLVLIALSGTPRAFARAATASGALILLSTVYLGFHWVLDLLTGVIAGCFVYGVARWMVYEDVAMPVPVTQLSPFSRASQAAKGQLSRMFRSR